MKRAGLLFGLFVLSCTAPAKEVVLVVAVSGEALAGAASLKVLREVSGRWDVVPYEDIRAAARKGELTFGIRIPEGFLGPVQVAAAAFGADRCLLGSAVGAAQIEGPEPRPLQLTLSASARELQPPICDDELPVLLRATPSRVPIRLPGLVTLEGFGFVPETKLRIHGDEATVQMISPVTIAALAPASGGFGAAIVEAENPRGAVVQRGDLLTYVPGNAATVQFAELRHIDAGTECRPYSLTSADFDGDGRPDLAYTGFESCPVALMGTITILWNQGDWSQPAPPLERTRVDLSSVGWGIGAGDVDRDGLPDLVAATRTGIAVLRNQGGQKRKERFVLTETEVPDSEPNLNVAPRKAVVLGQVLGDARPDLLVAVPGPGRLDSFINLGSSRFAAPLGVNILQPVDLALADFDRNGWQDVLLGGNGNQGSVSLIMSLQDRLDRAGAESYNKEVNSSNVFGIAAGDLDGDGWPDGVAVGANTDRLVVLRNRGMQGGSMRFEEMKALPTRPEPIAVALGDIDGDGCLEVLVGSSGRNTEPAHLSIFLNGTDADRCTGKFRPGPQLPLASLQSSTGMRIQLLDLDGDGRLDVVVGLPTLLDLAVLLNRSE